MGSKGKGIQENALVLFRRIGFYFHCFMYFFFLTIQSCLKTLTFGFFVSCESCFEDTAFVFFFAISEFFLFSGCPQRFLEGPRCLRRFPGVSIASQAFSHVPRVLKNDVLKVYVFSFFCFLGCPKTAISKTMDHQLQCYL